MKTQRYLIEIKSNQPKRLDWSEDIKAELKYAFGDAIIKIIKIPPYLRIRKLKGGKKKHGRIRKERRKISS